jgi:hypothetical protein
MADDQAGLVELIKLAVAVTAGAVVKPVFDYFSGRKKFSAEANAIAANSERLTQHDLREWMDTAQIATRRISRVESVLLEIVPYLDKLPKRTAERVQRVLNDGGEKENQ